MILAQNLTSREIEMVVEGSLYVLNRVVGWLKASPYFGRWATNWLIAPISYDARDRELLEVLTVWSNVSHRISIEQIEGRLVVRAACPQQDCDTGVWIMAKAGRVDPWWLADVEGMVAVAYLDEIPEESWL